MPIEIPEPWISFLREVDQTLERRTIAHCLGGFVLMVMWARDRPTGDVDIVNANSEDSLTLRGIAGQGTDIADKYGVYFDVVTVAELPEAYRSRLIDLTPPFFSHLELLAFEIHDLVLAKLGRFGPRDREDIAFLGRARALDLTTLRERFETEVRPYALNERTSAHLELCLNELTRISSGS